jgi:RNA polymerase sigma factor (sigma-70 family)
VDHVAQITNATVTDLTLFDDFYRAEYSNAVRLAWTLTGRKDLAEEIAQDAFLAAHRRWGVVGSYDLPGAWVRRLVLNASTSRRRRIANEARVVLRLGRERELQASTTETIDLVRAIRKLPARQAQVMALLVAEDLSIVDIAGVLELSEDTVRTHLRRGRERLSELLADTSTDGMDQ